MVADRRDRIRLHSLPGGQISRDTRRPAFVEHTPELCRNLKRGKIARACPPSFFIGRLPLLIIQTDLFLELRLGAEHRPVRKVSRPAAASQPDGLVLAARSRATGVTPCQAIELALPPNPAPVQLISEQHAED